MTPADAWPLLQVPCHLPVCEGLGVQRSQAHKAPHTQRAGNAPGWNTAWLLKLRADILFNYILLFMLLQLSPLLLLFVPLYPAPLQEIPTPMFMSMSMGHACMIFGYSFHLFSSSPSSSSLLTAVSLFQVSMPVSTLFISLLYSLDSTYKLGKS